MFVVKVNFLKRKNVVSEFSLGEIWQAADQAQTSEVFLHSERAEPKEPMLFQNTAVKTQVMPCVPCQRSVCLSFHLDLFLPPKWEDEHMTGFHASIRPCHFVIKHASNCRSSFIRWVHGLRRQWPPPSHQDPSHGTPVLRKKGSSPPHLLPASTVLSPRTLWSSCPLSSRGVPALHSPACPFLAVTKCLPAE